MKNVPFVSLRRQFSQFEESLVAKFRQVGKSGQYVFGQELEKFEKEIAQFCGTKFALGVGNGSDALFLVLKALDIGPGDEVITVSNSFIATAWVIAATGATIKFVDIGRDLNIDTDEIEKAITKKTRAIIPVHIAGSPANMTALNRIAKRNKVHIVEDAAQAIGSIYKGKKVGSFGVAAGFSLHPLKNLSIYGDGGVVVTNQPYIYKKIKKLRNHGLKNRDSCALWGYNSRLDTLQAAFARIKLKKLPEINKRHKLIAKFYCEELASLVEIPHQHNLEDSVFHNFIIRVKNRKKLQSFLAESGVETKIHYPIPIHLQECSKHLNYKRGDLPKTEFAARQILSLPIFAELKEIECEYVVKKIKKFFRDNTTLRSI